MQVIYTDGGVLLENPSPIAGAWAFVLVEHDGANGLWRMIGERSGIIVPNQVDGKVSNNIAEYLAVVHALEHVPQGWSGEIRSDSQVTIGRMSQGWKLHGIPEWASRRAKLAIERAGTLTWVLLQGHPSRAEINAGVGKSGRPVDAFNVICDRMCRMALRKWSKE